MSASLAAAENRIASLALAAMMVLPLAEMGLRRAFGVGVPASGPLVQHLTLWIGLLGAAVAARERKLLALATASFRPEGPFRAATHTLVSAVSALLVTLLTWGAVMLVVSERDAGTSIGAAIRVWVIQLALPVAFGLIAGRLVCQAGASWRQRLLSAAGPALAAYLLRFPATLENQPVWPWLIVVVEAAAFGAPIAALLGGAAALLFHERRRDAGGGPGRDLRAQHLAAATWESKWELAMPALVMGALFTGAATAIEASALTAGYALIVQTVARRISWTAA